MIKHNFWSSVLLTVALIGFAAWFGGNLSRTAIGYDIFKPEAVLSLKDNYNDAIRMQNIYLFADLAIYTDVGYGLFAISLIIYALRNRKSWKQNGWLLMSLILLLLALPVQAYFFYMDWRLAHSVVLQNVRDFYDWEVQEFFYNRFVGNNWTVLSSLSFLTTTAAAACFAWLPLIRKENANDN
ncbi:MAG: hypothetical protein WHV28_00710 [Bacteroidota bacterium]